MHILKCTIRYVPDDFEMSLRHTNAEPPPLLHPTIVDQLHLWDRERNRLKTEDCKLDKVDMSTVAEVQRRCLNSFRKTCTMTRSMRRDGTMDYYWLYPRRNGCLSIPGSKILFGTLWWDNKGNIEGFSTLFFSRRDINGNRGRVIYDLNVWGGIRTSVVCGLVVKLTKGFFVLGCIWGDQSIVGYTWRDQLTAKTVILSTDSFYRHTSNSAAPVILHLWLTLTQWLDRGIHRHACVGHYPVMNDSRRVVEGLTKF